TFAITVTDIDDVAPAVTAAAINDGLTQRSKIMSIAMTFSEEVSVIAGALSLHNETTGEDFDLSTVPFNTTTCTWDTSDVALTDGYYTGTLSAAGVEDTAGNPMASDYEFTFHVLKCDANGDAKVDGGDLAIWQQHYDPLGQNPNTPGMGDWNGDGKVDGGDLALWQQRYNPLGLVAPMKAGATSTMTEAEPVMAEAQATSAAEPMATLPLATVEVAVASPGSESAGVDVLSCAFLSLRDPGDVETVTQPATGWDVMLPETEGTPISRVLMPESATPTGDLGTDQTPSETVPLPSATGDHSPQGESEELVLGDGLEDVLALPELAVPLAE
ncbi:MAG TPA: dockerin type I domain-containing protein, partial [Phycisphaerae bacterium]|nr:dockerin type I domain-containing protein [Phycisphaerae bacterium]